MRMPLSFGSDDARENVNSAPEDFPIHFLCAVFTTEGQLGSCSIMHCVHFYVVQSSKEFLAHLGSQHVPLSQGSSLDQSSASPGPALLVNLLVCQHGVVHGIPVDQAVSTSDVPFLPQLQKQPLGPFVVFRVARTTLNRTEKTTSLRGPS